MNKKTELDNRRLNLINRIMEKGNEFMAEDLEFYFDHPHSKPLPDMDYPFAPGKKELHSIIEQVLEDDRNGLMLDGEEVEREIREYIKELTREQEEVQG